MKIKNNMLKKLNFSLELVNIFNDYANFLDEYFSVQENIENNYDLYLLYNDLKSNILNLSEKYGADKWTS